MVATEGNAHAVADLDLVAAIHNGFLDDSADREDRGLGGIHDRAELLDAVGAEIGDGDRPACVFLGLELLVTGAESEVLDGGADLLERELLGIADNGGDKAILDGDGHGEVHTAVLDDGVSGEGGIDLRLLHGGAGHGGEGDVVEGDLATASGDVLLAEGHHR